MLPQSISPTAYPPRNLNREQIESLKQPVDLREEIGRDLGPGQRSGKWRKYHSPFRDDNNPSFAVCEGVFIDFATGQRGDILTWLQDYRGLGFREALAWLSERDRSYLSSDSAPSRHATLVQATLSNPNPPPPTWQQIALHELQQAERCLWSPVGAKALAYLRNLRGLNDETIRRFRLGYNPAWKCTQYRNTDNGKPAHLAPGIVIPWFIGQNLWALKVRCRIGNLAQTLGIKPDSFLDKSTRTYVEAPKYLNLAGGNQAAALFNADALTSAHPILIVEGEFDAMLAWQYARDQVAAVTLGSASYELPPHWRERFASAPLILSALDNDQAGEKATAKLVTNLGNQIHPVSLPTGKDLTEFIVDHHGNAPVWIQQILTTKVKDNSSAAHGLPDVIRQAGLAFLTAAVVMVAELWRQAAQNNLLRYEQPFTIQELHACAQQLGWSIKASAIAEALATDKQAGNVFFEKLDPKTLQESCVQDDSGSNNPKKGGRPADHYRAKSTQAIVEALLLHAYFRLTEKHYPLGGKALAQVDAHWFTALGFEHAEAERLAEHARQRFANLPVDIQASARSRRDYNTLQRRLKQALDGDTPSSPLPPEWSYGKPSQYRAAVLRALVEAAPNQQRSRRSLAYTIGVSDASISAYLERAGIENIKQFKDKLLSTGALAKQIQQAERSCQGYACRLISLCAENSSEIPFNWRSLPQTEKWVRTQQAAGANVFIRLQVASIQRITAAPSPMTQKTKNPLKQTKHKITNSKTPVASRSHCVQPIERAHTIHRHRYLGPTFNPTWVTEQLLLAHALAAGQTYQPGRVYDSHTGEILITADTPAQQLATLLIAQHQNTASPQHLTPDMLPTACT